MLLHTGTSRRQIVRCFQGVFPVGSAIWPRTDGRADSARGSRELRSCSRPVAERHHRHLYLLLSRKSGIRGRQKLTRQGRGSVFRIRVTVAVFHTAGLVKHQHNIGRHRGRNRGRRTIAGRSQMQRILITVSTFDFGNAFTIRRLQGGSVTGRILVVFVVLPGDDSAQGQPDILVVFRNGGRRGDVTQAAKHGNRSERRNHALNKASPRLCLVVRMSHMHPLNSRLSSNRATDSPGAIRHCFNPEN